MLTLDQVNVTIADAQPSIRQADPSTIAKVTSKGIRRLIAAPDITQCGCKFTRRGQRGKRRLHRHEHVVAAFGSRAALSVPATPRLGHVRDEDAFHLAGSALRSLTRSAAASNETPSATAATKTTRSTRSAGCPAWGRAPH